MASNQSEKAYWHIRKKLMDGTALPGSRLSYGPIGKEIGVSATPVREAVGQLASEGFVELVPQLGAVVRELSREEAVELYELREALESFACARAAERIAPRGLALLRDILEKAAALIAEVRASGEGAASDERAKRFHACDLSFHMTILEATRNRRMLKLVGDSHMLTRIFQADRHGFTLEILDSTQAEHEAIAEAIASGDGVAAKEAMRRHIRRSLEQTLSHSDNPELERWWDVVS